MSKSECTTPPLKTCTKCGREHPATSEYFRARAGSKLRALCKVCASAHSRAWRGAHPGYWSDYHVANREKINERGRAYYAAHVDEYAAHCRAYHAERPGHYAAATHNYKARKKGNGGTHTAEDIRAQHDRQKGRCFYCGAKVGENYHRDHVMPLILGGSNGPENLVIACPTCNLSKGAKHPMEFSGRLL